MMLAKGNTGCLSLCDSGKANVGNFIHFHFRYCETAFIIDTLLMFIAHFGFQK